MAKVRMPILFVLAVFIFSCKNTLSPSEYIDQVNNNIELNKRYNDAVYWVSCSYKPTDYLALLELGDKINQENQEAREKFGSLKESFSKADYFILKIGLVDSSDIIKYGVRNESEYARRINEITFNMSKYAYLLTSEKDTVKALLHDFQRSYGMSPNATIMFAFPNQRISQKNGEVEFVYDDRYFGIPSPIRFSFNLIEIKKELPKLKILSNE